MPGSGHRWRGCSRRAARVLEPVLLLLLHHDPAHGYTLLEQLGEYNLGELSPSVVYRALRDIETRGWVTSTWDDEQTQGPPRRVYRLTAEGDRALAMWTEDLRETRRMIDHILRVYAQHMRDGAGEHDHELHE